MTIERQQGVAGLPASDSVWAVAGAYYRLRAVRLPVELLAPEEGKSAPRLVMPQAVAFELQVAPCDSTGDVLKDDSGANIIFPAERHSVDINTKFTDAYTVQQWARDCITGIIDRAVGQCTLATMPDPFLTVTPE